MIKETSVSIPPIRLHYFLIYLKCHVYYTWRLYWIMTFLFAVNCLLCFYLFIYFSLCVIKNGFLFCYYFDKGMLVLVYIQLSCIRLDVVTISGRNRYSLNEDVTNDWLWLVGLNRLTPIGNWIAGWTETGLQLVVTLLFPLLSVA